MSKNGMLAAVAAAAGLDASQPVNLTSALLKEHFPGIAAELSAEGAAKERARITELEAASLAGHEQLLAAFKADGSKTAGDLALAIVGAEKTKRSAMLANLDADEAKVKGLRSEPANGTEAPKSPLAGLKGKELWEAEYAADEKLQNEFPTAAAYAGYMSLAQQGRIRTTAKSTAQ